MLTIVKIDVWHGDTSLGTLRDWEGAGRGECSCERWRHQQMALEGVLSSDVVVVKLLASPSQ